MTGKDRVLEVLRGGMPDRVPFAPNIGQWFSYRQHTGTLPSELEGCEDELDAMMRLGCDVFTRRLGPFYKTAIADCQVRRFYESADGGNSFDGSRRQEIAPPTGLPFAHEEPHPDGVTVVTEIETPAGHLQNRARFVPESHTTFEQEHFVKYQRDHHLPKVAVT